MDNTILIQPVHYRWGIASGNPNQPSKFVNLASWYVKEFYISLIEGTCFGNVNHLRKPAT